MDMKKQIIDLGDAKYLTPEMLPNGVLPCGVIDKAYCVPLHQKLHCKIK
jgi:hypothetical protein